MIYILLSFVFCFIGIIPILLEEDRRKLGYAIGIISSVIWSGINLAITPTVTTYPLLGIFSLIVLINLVISCLVTEEKRISIWSTAILVSVYIIVLFFCSEMTRASSYRDLIGPIEKRTWTQDVQPKDEGHLRLIKKEYAVYKARQIISSAGTIGSQFEVDAERTTLQAIKGELWYIVPIDFSSFLIWRSVDEIPGYIRVHAEDTNRKAEFISLPKGKGFRYSPNSFWYLDLVRHLRMNGFMNEIYADIQIEIDDDEQPHWIVSLATPTIGYFGPKITGVLIVDPVTGIADRKALSDIPKWVDRVFPACYIKDYLEWNGKYVHGWWSVTWGSKEDTFKPENPTTIYSAEQHPDFVTGTTSLSDKDTSLLGYMYTNPHDGKTIFYEVKGGSTDAAIINAVNKNQDVQFRHLHGSDAQTYNISGNMASVVILSNDSNIFQGVAIVLVTSVETMAIGKTAPEALQGFRALLAKSGQRVALNKDHTLKTIQGVVDRARFEPLTSGTVYYIHIKDTPHIFTGGSSDFRTLPVTERGDMVNIEFIDSTDDFVPIHAFNNLSLVLSTSPAQKQVENRSVELRDREEAATEGDNVAEQIKHMNPGQLRELGKLLKQTQTSK